MSDKGRRDTFDVEDLKKPSDNQYQNKNKNNNNNNSSKIKAEVDKISKKGYISPADIMELYNKYGNDNTIIDEILRQRAKKHQKIKKQAKSIAEKIYRKYNSGSRPLHEILDRMMRYKIQNKWTDAEYEEFRKELTAMLTGNRALEVEYNQNLMSYKSRISRALGGIQKVQEDGLHIKDSEHGVLNKILSMYQQTFNYHKMVVMHSLMYEDCSLVAMTGEYKRDKNIASNYIHPIIACMFLPKFDIFEIYMLYSNFGNIIKSRYEKRPIETEPDTLLFDAITSDPNDVVCEVNSAIGDIKNRYKVQISLWDTVLKLRNGNYYDANPISEFLTTLNACRNNLYDNADLAYNQDEGAIMRRLLSVFSLRPTVIYTKPLYSVSSYIGSSMGIPCDASGFPMIGERNNNNFSSFPFNNQPVYTITRIPMITLQIPLYTENAEPKDLRSATSQTIWINENKTIIPKEQSIIHSSEVLIFYVNRRIQRIQIKTFSNPITFSQLPLTMSSFERLNRYPINVPDRLTLGRVEETYNLRSVVAVTETEIFQSGKNTNIITGHTGLIMTHRNFEKNIFEPKYYLYDPFGASLPVRHPLYGTDTGSYDGYFTNKPISFLEPIFTPPPETTDGIINRSFFDRASLTGTIFIYAKPTGYDPREVISV